MARGALATSGFARHEADGRVWYEGGAGPTLVLLHGTNDHAGTWFAVAPTLARQYRVILPDLAGHGESAPHAGPIPISRVIVDLEALLRDDNDLTLAGNSFGGWMALLYTLRNPERVVRVYLESSGGLRRPLAVPIVAQTRQEAVRILAAVHGPNYVPEEWVIEALLQRASGSPMIRLTELIEHDIEPRLHEIRVPTTLIWGADDGVLPLGYGQALRDAIPNATLRVIDGAAHIPHLQQPATFLKYLTASP
jgi:pimeloyl-ACP methyl ester carboxylesterase